MALSGPRSEAAGTWEAVGLKRPYRFTVLPAVVLVSVCTV